MECTKCYYLKTLAIYYNNQANLSVSDTNSIYMVLILKKETDKV